MISFEKNCVSKIYLTLHFDRLSLGSLHSPKRFPLQSNEDCDHSLVLIYIPPMRGKQKIPAFDTATAGVGSWLFVEQAAVSC